jgi:hypothetical protein
LATLFTKNRNTSASFDVFHNCIVSHIG